MGELVTNLSAQQEPTKQNEALQKDAMEKEVRAKKAIDQHKQECAELVKSVMPSVERRWNGAAKGLEVLSKLDEVTGDVSRAIPMFPFPRALNRLHQGTATARGAVR